jgi:hypothetical protein
MPHLRFFSVITRLNPQVVRDLQTDFITLQRKKRTSLSFFPTTASGKPFPVLHWLGEN